MTIINEKQPSTTQNRPERRLVSSGETRFWVVSSSVFLSGCLAVFLFVAPHSSKTIFERKSASKLDTEFSGHPVSLLKTGSISSKYPIVYSQDKRHFQQKPVQSNTGITILSRATPRVTPPQPVTSSAPIAQGADRGHGFAISLGNAQAFDTLSKRFKRIATLNAALFKNLEPRAILFESKHGLSAKLIAGPFATEQEADNACGIIKIPVGIPCDSEPFDGELISRH